MSFKYERLPNHCYWCGNLTHMDRECSIWTKRKGALLEAEQQFGLWLRATTPNLARKTVVRVAGFEEEGNVVGDQSTIKTPGCGRNVQTERENDTDSASVFEAHNQDIHVEGGQGVLVDEGVKEGEVHSSCMAVNELPVIEVGMQRRNTDQDFQEQLDGIDAELSRFEIGKGMGKGSGPESESCGADQSWALVDDSNLTFNMGVSQQLDKIKKGSSKGRVGRKSKSVTRKEVTKPTDTNRTVLRKRIHQELNTEVVVEDECKRSRNADFTDLTVEAGCQPRRSQ